MTISVLHIEAFADGFSEDQRKNIGKMLMERVAELSRLWRKAKNQKKTAEADELHDELLSTNHSREVWMRAMHGRI